MPSDRHLEAAAAMAAQAAEALRRVQVPVAMVDPVALLTLPGVLAAEAQDGELPTEALLADFDAMLKALSEMRAGEGQALAEVLAQHLAEMTQAVTAAKDATAARGADQDVRFRTDLTRLMDAAGQSVDPAKLSQDLANLVIKGDVSEELSRLDAHLAAARTLLASDGPVGRKLDFLMQEFNREANTLCAKSSDSALTQAGLDLKVLIDQMREQVQNVE